MYLFYQPELPDHLYLTPDESRHAVKVLRKKTGDEIQITDGRGSLYHATIGEANSTRCSFAVDRVDLPPRRSVDIHLAIAPTKNMERMEWMVAKVVELGVTRISFLQCTHSERKKINLDRLVRISVSAMKQSLQYRLPEIRGVEPFKSVIETAQESQLLLAEGGVNARPILQAVKKGGSVLILVGPEGGFSPEELAYAKEKGVQAVSLGPTRLRTETAGLVACTAIHLANHKG